MYLSIYSGDPHYRLDHGPLGCYVGDVLWALERGIPGGVPIDEIIIDKSMGTPEDVAIFALYLADAGVKIPVVHSSAWTGATV